MKKLLFLLPVIILFVTACGTRELQEARYKEKITQLVPRAKAHQIQAKADFQVAMEDLSTYVMLPGSNLMNDYTKLQRRYKQAEKARRQTQYFIQEIDERSSEMFRNWKRGLDRYENNELRYQSLSNYQQSQTQYQDFIQAMRLSEAKMQVILDRYNDQLLFISQNMNPQSISRMQNDVYALDAEVTELSNLIDRSVLYADQFLRTLNRP